MTAIEALEKVRSDALERRENVWKRHTALRGQYTLAAEGERRDCCGRMDAYEAVASFIDELINDLEDREREAAVSCD